MEITFDILLIIFCIIVIIETIYDQGMENNYNETFNRHLRAILLNTNYILRTHELPIGH